MYIYLDESYNLKDRNKKQFISINEFMVLDEKPLFKEWKKIRRPFAKKKRRIHAADSYYDALRPKALEIINKKADLNIVSVFQVLQEIPAGGGYWNKKRLNFDKICQELVKHLMKNLNLDEYRFAKVNIDSRKYKSGALGKVKFKRGIIDCVRENYPGLKIELSIQPSTGDVLIELADFISNILYRAYIDDDIGFMDEYKYKIIQIKNPLKADFL